jgi:hypothetical protein
MSRYLITFNFLSSTSKWSPSELGYKQKVETRDALHRRILDAKTHVKNEMWAARSTHGCVRKCLEVQGGNFEQRWNGNSWKPDVWYCISGWNNLRNNVLERHYVANHTAYRPAHNNQSFVSGTTARRGPWPSLFGFVINFRHTVGLSGRVISSSQGLYRHMTARHRKIWRTIHALSGNQTRDPVYERSRPKSTHIKHPCVRLGSS